MHISFSPQYSDAKLKLLIDGDKLIINGDVLDFSDLPEGGSYPIDAIDNDLIAGGVSRINGEIHAAVILPYKLSNPPRSVAFPDPVTVAVNGRVALPTDGLTEPEEVEEGDDHAAG
ncbi:hypothetical protein [Pseudochrobactrum sp. MP213Fo]|uniref:hypothetical protein n=1 Tax=Pseudochrobactrum sp. MP213Fo TaxID=3022250 RepID=UPI003BA220CF